MASNETKRALLERARSYRETANHLYRQIAQLDCTDPENREAARMWAMQAEHATAMGNEAERYAARLDDE